MSEPEPAAPQFAVVAQGDMEHLREVQSALRSRGVGSQVLPPPPELGIPAGAILFLAVATEDAQSAAQIVRDLWGRDLDPDTIASASRAIDLEAEQCACPACGESFAPSETRCPGCGLRIA